MTDNHVELVTAIGAARTFSHDLLDVLGKLVDQGNSVLVIEHNLDVIRSADHVIDLGPEGGAQGGRIVAQGTPEEVARVRNSATGAFLADGFRTQNDSRRAVV